MRRLEKALGRFCDMVLASGPKSRARGGWSPRVGRAEAEESARRAGEVRGGRCCGWREGGGGGGVGGGGGGGRGGQGTARPQWRRMMMVVQAR